MHINDYYYYHKTDLYKLVMLMKTKGWVVNSYTPHDGKFLIVATQEIGDKTGNPNNYIKELYKFDPYSKRNSPFSSLHTFVTLLQPNKINASFLFAISHPSDKRR